MNLVLPEAFAFMAAAVWLLVATGGPGGAAVRRAVAQLRGTGAEPKTVPLAAAPGARAVGGALRQSAVVGFGSPVWRFFAVAVSGRQPRLVARRPRIAAVSAVARA